MTMVGKNKRVFGLAVAAAAVSEDVMLEETTGLHLRGAWMFYPHPCIGIGGARGSPPAARRRCSAPATAGGGAPRPETPVHGDGPPDVVGGAPGAAAVPGPNRNLTVVFETDETVVSQRGYSQEDRDRDFVWADWRRRSGLAKFTWRAPGKDGAAGRERRDDAEAAKWIREEVFKKLDDAGVDVVIWTAAHCLHLVGMLQELYPGSVWSWDGTPHVAYESLPGVPEVPGSFQRPGNLICVNSEYDGQGIEKTGSWYSEVEAGHGKSLSSFDRFGKRSFVLARTLIIDNNEQNFGNCYNEDGTFGQDVNGILIPHFFGGLDSDSQLGFIEAPRSDHLAGYEDNNHLEYLVDKILELPSNGDVDVRALPRSNGGPRRLVGLLPETDGSGWKYNELGRYVYQKPAVERERKT